jgi:hypothetical protein
MRALWGSTMAVGLAVPAALAIAACGRTDGAPVDPTTLGVSSCASDLDCGTGRYCAADGTCGIDCVHSADCSLKNSDPNAPNDLVCSLCGRCIAQGARDTGCLGNVDIPCTASSDCAPLGAAYSCSADGVCVKSCGDDTSCHDIGRGWGCLSGTCARKCFHDQDCFYFGWSYACNLPPDVQKTNEDAPMPAQFAACKKGPSPYPPPTVSDPPSAKYQGTWGMLSTSAVRVDNVPVVTRLNSVAVDWVLVKATWSGGDLSWTFKWCAEEVNNFLDSDIKAPDLVKIVVPDLAIDSTLVQILTAKSVPTLAPGATFDTSMLIDVRGARGLANPTTDPLPTYRDLTHQWDQDRDGNPGITKHSTGLLTGDLYGAQRTTAIYHVNVVDPTHLQGLLTTTAAATVLGATKPDLINDAVTSTHPDPTRTYFRAIRLDDGASCDDVIRIGAQMGSWLDFTPHYDPTMKP